VWGEQVEANFGDRGRVESCVDGLLLLPPLQLTLCTFSVDLLSACERMVSVEEV
jgi:hypothetical protein